LVDTFEEKSFHKCIERRENYKIRGDEAIQIQSSQTCWSKSV